MTRRIGTTRTVRSSLVRSFGVVITALVFAVVAAAALDGHMAIQNLSRALINQAIDRAETDVEGFFEPVERAVVTMAGLIGEGQMPLHDLVDSDGRATEQFLELNRRFSGLLRFLGQAQSLILADDAGIEYMLLQEPDGWINRLTRPGQAGVHFRWTDASPMPVHVPELDRPDYDYRTRPWFQEVANTSVLKFEESLSSQRKSLQWTPPYRFFTSGRLGISVVGRAEVPDGTHRTIVVDVALRDLSRFSMTNRIGKSGMISIVSEIFVEDGETRDDWVYTIGMPAGIEVVAGADWPSLLGKSPEQLGMPVFVDAIDAFQAAVSEETREELEGASRDELAAEQTFRSAVHFESEREDWWFATRLVPLGKSDRLWIIGLVPESDLLFGADRVGWGLGVVFLIIFGLALRHAMSLAGYFSKPLETLAHENRRIAQGDLDTQVELVSDLLEIQTLVEAQERMRMGLRTLLKMEGDLQLARRIQQGTLPGKIPEVKRFDIAGWSEPAEETGGDTWDLIQREDGRVWLFLADATGHGVGPALSVVQVRAMIRAIASMGTPLAEAVKRINNELCVDLPDGRFITLWFGELDPDTRSLRTYSAGQAPLIHYVADEDRFDILGADGPPFGVIPDQATRVLPEIKLEKNDLFLVVSDGVYEAEAPDDEQMGVDRLLEIVRSRRGKDAEAIVDAIRVGVAEFANGRPSRDDQTVVLVRGR